MSPCAKRMKVIRMAIGIADAVISFCDAFAN